MYFSTTLILLLVVVNILVSCLQKIHNKDDNGEKNDSSSSLFKQRAMASSSSSSNFNFASDSHSWKYEVFISFRGEDTRKGFVDHLYKALLQQGIETYKDDVTLPRGSTIGPALIKAIQESRIAVIVFSKNYANSSWCLDELAHIVDCMEKKGQNVMPVFYNVNPSDVRKQKRKYGEAFTKHIECEDMHKIKLWREALAKAGNLSGWDTKKFANGHEAKCIEDIVTTICRRLSPLFATVDKNLIGIETRLKDLNSMLKIGSDGVLMVGLWGVGGSGKTTLASAAYMQFSRQFEACCFLENVRDESSKLGLTKLQEKFLSIAMKKKEKVGSEMEGKNMIKRKLGCKSVLVVLDDVNEREQLEALAGSHDWFGEGSRIIITTRDKHLLALNEATVYEVSLLSDDEAIKLFSRHAFKEDEPVEDYKALSQEVVSYSGRLPLALEILGSFLYAKNKEEWMHALAKLKHIPNVKVMERLKISYDGLDHDVKELFLDIACFLRGWDIDSAMEVLKACSFYPDGGVKVLVQKSLIKVSNERFEMHDLIEEMAHYIVRGEHHDNPEKHSRIWKLEDIKSICDTGAAAAETQVLKASGDYKCVDPESIYDNNLRLLDLIGNMKKLRWIYWFSYPLKQLWVGNKILPNLKNLDLSYSRNLMTTPDFKGLPRLERLILVSCESLEEIHSSIGYHERLVFVNMSQCGKLKTFPPIIRMKKLKTLDLSWCRELHIFPDIQTNMDSLENVHLKRSGIEIIQPSVGEFCTNLVSFDLRECSKLKRIEGDFRLLKHLKCLQLNSSDQLEKLAGDFFHEECCLEELSLKVPRKLPQFPRFLRKLNISCCKLEDGDMPSDMSGLINLQVLDLSQNYFSQLHSNLSEIPCLKLLDLSNCELLEELPDLPSSIAILIAFNCDSLQSVGDLSNCKWLWKVNLLRYEKKKVIGGGRLVHSMVQRNTVEDRFMSILLPHAHQLDLREPTIRMTVTLQLPHNWYNDFSGFLFSADAFMNDLGGKINIKQEMLSMDSQSDHHHWDFQPDHDHGNCNIWCNIYENPECFYECGMLGYVPFGSLSHTSWWNPTYTHITFQFKDLGNPKVRLVPRKSKSMESSVDYSECWDEEFEDSETFEITDNPKSSQIDILWLPGYIY